jgi:RimJ/RimL family protein N-acetyltransferase
MNYRNKGSNIAEIGIKICDFDMQNKGYGTLFLKMLITSLFANRYKKIILDTNVNNVRAQHVYEKLGFTKLRINHNSWENQLGVLQSSVDYELHKSQFIPLDI